MGTKAVDDWTRDSAGYVSLVPVETCAAGVTDHGEIALSLGGHTTAASGSEEHCGQYVCSTREAMNIARSLVQAVAMADTLAWALPGQEKKDAG